MNSQISNRIKQYRMRAGLTQNDVSMALGINRATYARQESHGKINPDLLDALASLLHVTPNQILYGESETDNTSETDWLHPPEQRSYEPLRLNAGEETFLQRKPLILTNNERNYIQILRQLTTQQQKQLEDFLMQLQNDES